MAIERFNTMLNGWTGRSSTIQSQDKQKMKDVYCGTLVFFGAFFGAVAFLLIVVLFGSSPVGDAILSAHGNVIAPTGGPLSAHQAEWLRRLISSGAVIPIEFLLAQISDFYTTIINILIGLIAALGVISYMYIRAQSDIKTQEYIKEYVESAAFKASFKNEVSEQLDVDVFQSIESFSLRLNEKESEVKELSEKIKEIENQFALNDKAENEGSELNLQ